MGTGCPVCLVIFYVTFGSDDDYPKGRLEYHAKPPSIQRPRADAILSTEWPFHGQFYKDEKEMHDLLGDDLSLGTSRNVCGFSISVSEGEISTSQAFGAIEIRAQMNHKP